MNEMVSIERAELERLQQAAEELAELRAYDRAKAQLTAGEDELVPAPFAHRLIGGESPVRVYRELRGQTQQQLAATSGVNRVQIAEIEAAKATGSVATLSKLADGLKVTLDDLVG